MTSRKAFHIPSFDAQEFDQCQEVKGKVYNNDTGLDADRCFVVFVVLEVSGQVRDIRRVKIIQKI